MEKKYKVVKWHIHYDRWGKLTKITSQTSRKYDISILNSIQKSKQRPVYIADLMQPPLFLRVL